MRTTHTRKRGLKFKSILPDKQNGSSILFVPGGGFNYHSGDPIVDTFSSEGYRSHSMSLRGHTGSYRPNDIGQISLDDYVVDIENVLDQVSDDSSSTFLIAHSLSSLPALKASNHSSVAGIVLLAPVYTKEVHERFDMDLSKLYNFPMPVDDFQAHLSNSKDEVEEMTLNHLDWFFSDGRNTKPYGHALSIEPWRTRWEFLVESYSVPPESVDKDLLVLIGEREPLMRKDGATTMAEIYGGKFASVDSSHMLMYDNWDSSAKVISNFLKEV